MTATVRPEKDYTYLPGEQLMFTGITAKGIQRLSFHERHNYVSERYCQTFGWLTPKQLDKNPLYLPPVKLPQRGQLTRIVSLDMTVLAWWGSPFTTAEDANTAIQALGIMDQTELWDTFTDRFKMLAPFFPRAFRPVCNGDRKVIR